MNNSIAEIKNILEGMKSTLSDTGECIKCLEDRIMDHPIRTAKRKANSEK